MTFTKAFGWTLIGGASLTLILVGNATVPLNGAIIIATFFITGAILAK